MPDAAAGRPGSRELARVSFFDPVDLVDSQGQPRPLREIPLDTRRALASVKVKRERVTRRVVGKGKHRATFTTHETVIEYRFWNKLDAVGRLFEFLGLSRSLPPLEVLLAALPPQASALLRAALAEGNRSGG